MPELRSLIGATGFLSLQIRFRCLLGALFFAGGSRLLSRDKRTQKETRRKNEHENFETKNRISHRPPAGACDMAGSSTVRIISVARRPASASRFCLAAALLCSISVRAASICV